jgi:23S rRNA pseudouridine1911/1915/1917 synthase
VSAALSILPNPRITFATVHEDDALIVVDKPPRLPTQPGKGHEDDTLLNGLFERFGTRLQNLGKARDFGLLHRLDKMASGLLVVALTPRAYDALRRAFEERAVSKFYWAVVKGPLARPSGVINKPIAEHVGAMKTARISGNGKPAVTAYRVLSEATGAALVECRAVTGRLHQVRVHLASIHAPILGDEMYAPAPIKAASPRLALHSHRLVFNHPVSGEKMDLRTRWPKDLLPLLKRMGLSRPDERDGEGQTAGRKSPGAGVGPDDALLDIPSPTPPPP